MMREGDKTSIEVMQSDHHPSTSLLESFFSFSLSLEFTSILLGVSFDVHFEILPFFLLSLSLSLSLSSRDAIASALEVFFYFLSFFQTDSDCSLTQHTIHILGNASFLLRDSETLSVVVYQERIRGKTSKRVLAWMYSCDSVTEQTEHSSSSREHFPSFAASSPFLLHFHSLLIISVSTTFSAVTLFITAFTLLLTRHLILSLLTCIIARVYIYPHDHFKR
jgi:hypothetical protein